MFKRTLVFCFILISIIILSSSFLFDEFKSIEYIKNVKIENNDCEGPDTIKILLPDSLHIVWAKLFWRKYSYPWDSIIMTHIGNYWIGIINIVAPATYNYYIKTIDSLNRIGTFPAGAPANYYSFIVGPDTTKPVITHTPIGNTPKANWPVSINASVIDNCGIDSVWVRWRINSGNFKQFKLINTSGNVFTAIFNSVQSEVNLQDTIRYRIIAKDISSYNNKDSTPLWNFVIIPPIGINSNTGYVPEKYFLYYNYPNPFNPITHIDFDIPKQGIVKLKIFDILGREVKELVNEVKVPGSYSVDFYATGLTSGIYLYRLECNRYIETRRLVLLK